MKRLRRIAEQLLCLVGWHVDELTGFSGPDVLYRCVFCGRVRLCNRR